MVTDVRVLGVNTATRNDITAMLIRSGRRNEGLTQDEFAAAICEAAKSEGANLKLTRAAVARWEQGTWLPALRYRRHIATVLGLEQRILFPGDL